MAEIEVLSARVQADTKKATASLSALDRQLDDVADDRVANIKINVIGDREAKKAARKNDLLGLIGFDKLKQDFSSYSGTLMRNATDTDRATKSTHKFGMGLAHLGHAARGLRAILDGLMIPIVISGFMQLGSVLMALGGGVIGLVASLSRLLGVLALIPGAIGAIVVMAGALVPAITGFMKGFQGLTTMANAAGGAGSMAKLNKETEKYISLLERQQVLADDFTGKKFEKITPLGNGQTMDTSTPGAGGGGVTDAEKAFNKLAPAAKSFALYLRSLVPVWDKLVYVTQQQFFPGVEKGLRKAMGLAPTLIDGLGGIGGELGTIAERFGTWLGSKQMQGDMSIFLKGVKEHLHKLAPALTKITQGFMNIVIAAKPLADFMVKAFSKGAQTFLNWTRALRDNPKAFDGVIQALKDWWTILKNIALGVKGVIGASNSSGFTDWVQNGLVEGSQTFNDWVNGDYGQTKLKNFFDTIKPTISEFMGLMKDVGLTIGGLFGDQTAQTNATEFIRAIRDTLPGIADGLRDFQSSEFVVALTEALGPLSQALATLFSPTGWLTIGATILGDLADAFNWLGDNIPGFSQAMTILLGSMLAFKAIKAVVPVIMLFGRALMFLSGQPLLLALIAIAALVYVIIRNWDTIKAFLGKVWNGIKVLADKFWQNGIVKAIREAIMAIVRVIKSVWVTAFNTAKTAIGVVVTAAKGLWHNVLEPWAQWIASAWSAAMSVFSALWDGVRTAIDFVSGAVGWLWHVVLEPLLEFLGKAFAAGFAPFKLLWEGLWAVIQFIIGALTWLWHEVLEPVIDFFKNAFASGMEGATVLWQGFLDVINTIIGAVKDLIGWVKDAIDWLAKLDPFGGTLISGDWLDEAKAKADAAKNGGGTGTTTPSRPPVPHTFPTGPTTSGGTTNNITNVFNEKVDANAVATKIAWRLSA